MQLAHSAMHIPCFPLRGFRRLRNLGHPSSGCPDVKRPNPMFPSATASSSPPLSSRILWRTSLLLFASVTICYIDRSNLSVAAPLLKEELGLSATSLGTLLSAFFWT